MIYSIARLLQLAGLVILPLAIMGEIGGHMALKDSLVLSGVGLTVFITGWLLQRTTKGE